MVRVLTLVLSVVVALGALVLAVGPSPHVAEAASAHTLDVLNLRTDPWLDATVITVIPPDSPVSIDGTPVNGYYPITYNGASGWAYGVYLDAPSSATAIDALNLRSGPSLSDPVLTVIPAGAAVNLYAGSANDFVYVGYGDTAGWAFGAYLTVGGDGAGKAATTTDNVNLRAGPSLSADVLRVVSLGSTVETTGAPVGNFYPVRYAGTAGWLFGDYLDLDGSGGGSGSLIAWPFESSSGPWYVTQGYNGPWSHWNASSTYQYLYSLDLRRVESSGYTAGQAVLSPVSGTIRWIDWSTGGMAIDLGNGYAVAYFHTYIAEGLAAGQRVTQGQYLGTIAEPGDANNGGTSHLHLTLWRTDDGGNWDRHAIPFTGAFAIDGVDLPDIGGSDQHLGTVIWP